MAAVLPTRGNLISTRRSLALAQTGFALMDRKRNILIREMMELIDTARDVQGRIDAVFTEAYEALTRANLRLGLVDEAAAAVPVDNSLRVRWRSVMGVELPRLTGDDTPAAPPYGFSYTSSALDDAYLKFRRAGELVRELAEIENAVYRLAQAIKKTQKRANALENIVIPGFDRTIRVITDALEEKEREEFVRLKVTKKKTAG